MPAPFAAFAACQPGLEPLLTRELQALGAAAVPQRGGAAFAADATLAMRACLWLGTASHVLLRLAEFPCRALGELQRKAALLPFRDWLRPDVPIAIRATARGSRVYHTGAIEERVDAAVRAALGRGSSARKPRAGGETEEAVAQLAVRFHDDVCTISVDASATPLHRRGYRLDGAKAPLREDVAHALVLASGFAADDALLDPFCGSGTIAIEAAGLALGLPPGRLRPPPLLHLALFDPDVWSPIAGERRTRAPGAANPAIAASDRDAGAVAAALANAERAGVAAAIEFRCCAVTAHPWLQYAGDAPPRGVLATNPPFGRRVRSRDDLVPLYQTLGHRIGRLGPAWRTALLALDVRLARRTGLPLRAAFTTRHGGLSVTALVTAASDRQRDDSAPDPLAPRTR
jgi:putative N6-adenine-specific DNA methylase